MATETPTASARYITLLAVSFKLKNFNHNFGRCAFSHQFGNDGFVTHVSTSCALCSCFEMERRRKGFHFHPFHHPSKRYQLHSVKHKFQIKAKQVPSRATSRAPEPEAAKNKGGFFFFLFFFYKNSPRNIN